MPGLDRRRLLAFLGAAISGRALAGCRAPSASAPASPFIAPDGRPRFAPVALPLPHAGDGGSANDDARRFANFEVADTLVLPAGFTWELLAAEGQRFGPPSDPARCIRFGTGADFAGVVPRAGHPGEFWLLVNHEFAAARAWLALAELERPELPRLRVVGGQVEVNGRRFDPPRVDLTTPSAEVDPVLVEDLRRLARAVLGDLGLSVLHVRRESHGGFAVLTDSPHHKAVRGDDPRTPTLANCGGALTPWRTFLSCEENFQDHVSALVDARGAPGTPGAPGACVPFEASGLGEASGPGARAIHPYVFLGLGSAGAPPFDGRDFGWVVHVDPESGDAEKLHALGRFQHENVALACRAGAPLTAYMGDDRTGGHVWRFSSDTPVDDPRSPANLERLRRGRLEVARFEPDGSGHWLALEPETALARPRPEHTAEGFVLLPQRRRGSAAGGAIRVRAAGSAAGGASADEWCAALAEFGGRAFGELALADLVLAPDGASLDPAALREHRQSVLRLDAFLMAGAIGATPCARPEDLELSPRDGSLFIAFTDAATSADGSPDARIFPDCRGESSRQYGLIVRLAEDPRDRARFTWSVFARSGELADGGGGFAAPDNLAFDADGHLWFVCDVAGADQNSAVDRRTVTPGSARFRGVFGPSALFVLPTHGPAAGIAHAFALGPAECELTGLGFAPDGRSILLSVQHPGEVHGARATGGRPASEERQLAIAARDGQVFVQRRSVPLGSNFPAGTLGASPRSCVVSIRRA